MTHILNKTAIFFADNQKLQKIIYFTPVETQNSNQFAIEKRWLDSNKITTV